MDKKEYHVVGVMSGTSLDGIDLVQAKFYFNGDWRFEILNAETMDYVDSWKLKLEGLVSDSMEELRNIDMDYTAYLGDAINTFLKKHKIDGIDAVCSHGHTALHQPERRLTYQIGNRSELASFLDEKVVCDFRVQDVEFNGQGAPLVPIGDKLLFSEYDYCINLGGFANISMDIDGVRVAYDICPMNIVLNYYAKKLGLDYDAEGVNASKGHLNDELLEALNKLSFYKEPHPKSLGLEWVNVNVFPLIESFELDVKDVLRTFVEHVAMQLANQINSNVSSSILITGGGAYNSFLIDRVREYTDSMVIIPSKDIIEFKEALIFGFLGVLKLREEVNCLKSVTGATENHSSGRVFLP
ncbi:anhydro-N-acetylmuramic acid kinase [uncultured Algibacter sp.]|uniref:anhydro-N-acetylmuramic acid kinase n=1 Tax=uncultured Algibacter sp. TaxID=298659 RepID=UPI0026017838|nr:anhydro-N-acetylmuramic acid kinase [uncultured Algibacter sp.]